MCVNRTHELPGVRVLEVKERLEVVAADRR
jgi:hypothetical protein